LWEPGDVSDDEYDVSEEDAKELEGFLFDPLSSSIWMTYKL